MAGGTGVGARIGPGGGAVMRALAWDPEQALTEPARLDEANVELTHMDAEERVAWVVQHLPGPQALSSSFGAQAAVSLHMVTRQVPAIPVILIDTGYLFPETYRFVDELAVRLSLNLKVVPAADVARLVRGHARPALGAGRRRHRALQRAAQDRADASCARRARHAKLVRGPAPRAVAQPPQHPSARIASTAAGRCYPIFDWTDRDVFDYLRRHDLPYHPLWHEGYVSIGDWHSTRTLAEAGDDEEATRFFGLKRECGLHGLDG